MLWLRFHLGEKFLFVLGVVRTLISLFGRKKDRFRTNGLVLDQWLGLGLMVRVRTNG